MRGRRTCGLAGVLVITAALSAAQSIDPASLESEAAARARAGENARARDLYEQALELRRAGSDRAVEARVINGLATAVWSLGDFHRAEALFGEALSLGEALGNADIQANAWHGLGRAHSSAGDWRRARSDWERALPLRRTAADRQGEAATLNNLGLAAWSQGEYEKAVPFLREALAIRRTIGDRRAEGDSLNAIGLNYWSTGETDLALDYFHAALAIRRATGDVRGEAITLHNAGLALLQAERYADARAYLRKALIKKRLIGDRAEEASTLRFLGECSAALGRRSEALAYLNQAIALYRALGARVDTALVLRAIARLELARLHPAQARTLLREALDMPEFTADAPDRVEALALLARAERGLGEVPEAERLATDAVNLSERVRGGLTDPDARASFTALQHEPYEQLIDILMRRHAAAPDAGYAPRAFSTVERLHARSLVEMLAEAQAEPWRDVDPDLLAAEREAESALDAAGDRLIRQLARAPRGAEAAALQRAFDERLAERDDLLARVRLDSPQYASLAMPPPVTIDDVRRDILDSGSVLVEYALGEECSYVWVVTPARLVTRRLPARAAIEAAAREYYRRVTAADQTANRAALERAAERLSSLVLAPIATATGTNRLLVVADGALQYVPFGALPHPRTGEPLIVSREVVMLPSASALIAVRAHQRAAPTHEVAVLADPVVSTDDRRLRAAAHAEALDEDADVRRSARDAGLAKLARLPYTQAEADAIAALAGPERTFRAIGFRANRSLALDGTLSSYRILHFATHALIDNRRPQLSGIVLSLVDEQGQPQDGFLRLQDIDRLQLGADVVVLSACRTALGRSVKGDGLNGLTRGFMYAGAPRVVAALWDVRDRATFELMTRFYRALFVARLAPAAALRAAQLEMLRDPRWSAPVSWAGFVLQGDWR